MKKSYEEIMGDLKQQKYAPVYFLHGEESYFIDQISTYIEQNILTESERSFNQTILYGKETEAKTLIDTAYRYPMMAAYQLVVLKEAQEMKTLPNIQAYIEKPVPTTVLVICHKHKRLKFNTKFGKVVSKNTIVFESKPLYDNQVPSWIKNYLQGKQLKIEPTAAALLAEFVGTDLSKITNEIDKLAISLPKGTTITPQIIEDNIGISKDYNVFELQKALAERNILKANRIVQYFATNPRNNPLVVVISSLYNYFSKVYMMHYLKNKPENELLKELKIGHAFFLKEYKLAARNYPLAKTMAIIGYLKEYDLKSKGVDFNTVGSEDGALLKELVWKILH